MVMKHCRSETKTLPQGLRTMSEGRTIGQLTLDYSGCRRRRPGEDSQLSACHESRKRRGTSTAQPTRVIHAREGIIGRE